MILSKRQNHLQRFLSRAILLFNFVNTGIVNGRRNETFNETLRDLKISVQQSKFCQNDGSHSGFYDYRRKRENVFGNINILFIYFEIKI